MQGCDTIILIKPCPFALIGMEKEIQVTEITTCRVCGSEKLSELFSLGNLYLSTFVERKGENIGKAPLALVWCDNCTLVQLKHTAPQELMYSRQYWYRSGLNKVIIDDLKEITERAMKIVPLQEQDIVLDIGANDGTLLQFYPKTLQRIGCEPATNLVGELKKHADIVIDDFWDFEKQKQFFSEKKAKIITAIGMFYDMDDPGQFIRDAVKALDKNGIFITQLMTAKPMLEKNDVGNICHEHLEFYSYASLQWLFEKNGLEIFKVEENAINGGSLRLFARHFTQASISYPEHITKKEYLDFAQRIQKNKEDCVRAVKELAQQGKKIYVYGASTKGNTILQYYGLDATLISGAAEIHPEKIGKYTVGTSIPIVHEQEAKKNADYFLVLPFGFRENFIKREEQWLKKGGAFIFCTPQFEIYNYKKKALIFGVTGQDGSYMAELLLEKGYEVHGLVRHSATGNTKNIQHILHTITLHKGDLADTTSLYRIIATVQPDELYNFADQDHVGWSYDTVDYSFDITGAAVGRILELIKQINPKIRFLQPISSNVFGKAVETPQTEQTPLYPLSPYACAKAFAYHLVRYYRETFGLFLSCPIFYNHESERRTEEYVTRKITKAVAAIHKGKQKKLSLGNITTQIDFGYAKDYVEACWNILQLEKPDDFIICTEEMHTVRELVQEAFVCVGISLAWRGEDLKEEGYDKHTGTVYVAIDPQFFRPSTTAPLQGNSAKARQLFGFQPKVRFKDLVQRMVENDLKEIEKEVP